jgi:hypothetical protein
MNTNASDNKALVIFAYARRDLLVDCIKSVLGAESSANWKKVIIWQKGDYEVYKIIKTFESYFDLVAIVTPQHSKTLANINQNRLIGTKICFEALNSDYVLGIEDDTLIAYDSLVFIEKMYEKYKLKRSFRGVNLGSIESKKSSKISEYSLLRYGLHGQAGMITSRTWSRIKIKKLFKDFNIKGWDASFEPVIKNGFMVTPNLSRSLDLGWQNPTHASSDSQNPHYTRMKLSWTGTNKYEIMNYSHKQVNHSWRSDAIQFKKRHTLFYFLKNNSLVKKIYCFLKN